MSRSDRREVLGGADVMVVLVAVDREATWRQDRVTHLIAGIWHDTGAHAEAINALNRAVSDGSTVITHLPEDAIVEVPEALNRQGAHAQPIGALPEPIAEWCRREATVSKLAVQATLEMNRDAAKQALILDPTTPTLTSVDSLLDAYLGAYADQLGGHWE